MNTQEIEHILYRNKDTYNIFKGVFPSNITPDKPYIYPYAYVFNIDKDTEPGSHWVAIYKESSDKLYEYFDSYGFPPLRLSFYKFIEDDFLTSDKTIQNQNTNVCGQHTINFILQRSRNVSFEAIVGFFSENTIQNDLYVYKKIKYESIQQNIENYQCSRNMVQCLEKYY